MAREQQRVCCACECVARTRINWDCFITCDKYICSLYWLYQLRATAYRPPNPLPARRANRNKARNGVVAGLCFLIIIQVSTITSELPSTTSTTPSSERWLHISITAPTLPRLYASQHPLFPSRHTLLSTVEEVASGGKISTSMGRPKIARVCRPSGQLDSRRDG